MQKKNTHTHTCFPVKPWQITRVFLSTKTAAVDMFLEGVATSRCVKREAVRLQLTPRATLGVGKRYILLLVFVVVVACQDSVDIVMLFCYYVVIVFCMSDN